MERTLYNGLQYALNPSFGTQLFFVAFVWFIAWFTTCPSSWKSLATRHLLSPIIDPFFDSRSAGRAVWNVRFQHVFGALVFSSCRNPRVTYRSSKTKFHLAFSLNCHLQKLAVLLVASTPMLKGMICILFQKVVINPKVPTIHIYIAWTHQMNEFHHQSINHLWFDYQSINQSVIWC